MAKISGAGQAPSFALSPLARGPVKKGTTQAWPNFLFLLSQTTHQQQPTLAISPTVTRFPLYILHRIFIKEDVYHSVLSATTLSYTANPPTDFPVSELDHPLRLTSAS
jgi:hypothetical protein